MIIVISLIKKHNVGDDTLNFQSNYNYDNSGNRNCNYNNNNNNNDETLRVWKTHEQKDDFLLRQIRFTAIANHC